MSCPASLRFCLRRHSLLPWPSKLSVRASLAAPHLSAEGSRAHPSPALPVQAAEGRACVVVVNKWDTIQAKTDKTLKDFEENVRAEVREPWAGQS